MKQLLSLFFLFGLLSCNPSAKQSEADNRKTVVYGHVIHQTAETPKVITVIACDPLDKNDRYAVRLNSKGEFRAEFDMLWGHSFTINYDRKFINAYANPGDSIYVEIDAAKFRENSPDAIRFGGNSAEQNREFNRIFSDLISIINYNAFTDFTLPLTDFMNVFLKEVKLVNDSIAKYGERNKISPWTQNLMRDMALYTLSNYATDYKGVSPEDEIGFYSQPIFDIFNNEKFKNMMFPYHLDAYFHRLISKDSLIANYVENNETEKATKYATEKIKKMPKSLSRDFMLYRLYTKIGIEPENIDERDFYNKGVYEKLLAMHNPEVTDDIPEFASGKGAFYLHPSGKVEHIENFHFEKLINEKYNGKVVYVDIWAEWCGPCLAEMAPARELQSLFRDKEVAFVNICMSSKQEAWIKHVKNDKIGGDNYYFDEDLSAEAAASLLSGGYPTYILIDKAGKIRNKNAPRPSALSEIGNEIDKLLSEK